MSICRMQTPSLCVFTLWPNGKHVSWNSWTVFVGAFTPAINSVNETICKAKKWEKRWSKNSRSIDKTNTKLVCINHNFRSLAFVMRTCCNDKFFRQISHRTAKHSTQQLNWIEIADWAPSGFQFETETMFHVVTSIYKYANYRHNTTAILVWSVPGFMKNVIQKCECGMS